MCGIIGGIEKRDIVKTLLSGLGRLEYRGYDSAGVAVLDQGRLQHAVVVGRVNNLRQSALSMRGNIGIGHTRWATHGPPSEVNAHPIWVSSIVIVHNGVIENHDSLRQSLLKQGRGMKGQTDTEVVAHLLATATYESGCLLEAVRTICPLLKGAYALAAISENKEEIIGVRQGSPLLVGVGRQGVYLSSDSQSLLGYANQIQYLEEGDSVRLTVQGIEIWDVHHQPVNRPSHQIVSDLGDIQLGQHRHFMQKEIFAQPDAIAATIASYVSANGIPMRLLGKGIKRVFCRCRSLTLMACGSSYNAALVASYWLAKHHILCRVIFASEYRYCFDSQASGTLVVAISQSGETADTLSAMRYAKKLGATTLAVVNIKSSSLAREADFIFHTQAGHEIGVAATKSFTSQLVALLLLTMAIAKGRGHLQKAQEDDFIASLRRLPHLLEKLLYNESFKKTIDHWGHELASVSSALYLGRHSHYPMALEGALKLKEISYIHAQGVAAGEIKHGTLALVDNHLPVIGLLPNDNLVAKMLANLSEVATRGGRLFIITSASQAIDSMNGQRTLYLEDDGGYYLSPIIYAIPLQLLAYHTALQKGTDIDKPRNLAKSVTVE